VFKAVSLQNLALQPAFPYLPAFVKFFDKAPDSSANVMPKLLQKHVNCHFAIFGTLFAYQSNNKKP